MQKIIVSLLFLTQVIPEDVFMEFEMKGVQKIIVSLLFLTQVIPEDVFMEFEMKGSVNGHYFEMKGEGKGKPYE